MKKPRGRVWGQPLFSELTSSKRRGQPGIIAHGLGVVWRVESSVGDVLGVVAEGTEFAPGVHDVLGVVHLDDAVVVLVADQGVTVPQTHGARGRWAGASRQVAACAVAGEVLPHYVLVSINLDDTVVIRIRDQGVAVFEPAGKRDTTDGIVDRRVAAAVLPDNVAAKRDRGRNLERAIVVFVADKNVAVLQKLGAVRVVEAIGKPRILYRCIELIGATTSNPKLPILPNNVASAVDQDHSVVGAAAGIGAVGRFGLTAGGSGASH